MSNSNPNVASTSPDNKQNIEPGAPGGADEPATSDGSTASDGGGAVLYTVEDATTIKEPTKRRKHQDKKEQLFTVEDGAAVADEILGADFLGAVGMLQRLTVRDGETTFVRFFTARMLTLWVHFSIPDDSGGQVTLRCNGKGRCALCKAKFSPTLYSLLPVFSTDERAIRVMQFGRKSGPGSLCTQVIRLLAKPDFTKYVYQIEKTRKLFVVKLFTEIGADDIEDRDLGDDVLRDLVQSDQMPTDEDVVATIDSMPDDEIIDTFERVARRLRQFGDRK